MSGQEKSKLDQILAWLDRSDYYQILNVPKDAKSLQMKEAYFKLSKQYHPDKFYTLTDADSVEKITQVFKRVNEAYMVLKNPQKRKRYDEVAFGPEREQNLRYQPGDADRGGPANLEDNAKTPNGKKYLKLALVAQKNRDWKTAEANLKFAINFEPENAFIKKMMEKIKSEIASIPRDENPFRIR